LLRQWVDAPTDEASWREEGEAILLYRRESDLALIKQGAMFLAFSF
jgi:hypothetical protein